jgi:AP-4 complex subunit sigma-1
LAQYFFDISMKERITLEGELVRKCLGRGTNKSSFLEHQSYKIVYRRYASLYFIVGLSMDEQVSRILTQNEQAYYDFIHNIVETFDKYFESVVRELWLMAF